MYIYLFLFIYIYISISLLSSPKPANGLAKMLARSLTACFATL